MQNDQIDLINYCSFDIAMLCALCVSYKLSDCKWLSTLLYSIFLLSNILWMVIIVYSTLICLFIFKYQSYYLKIILLIVLAQVKIH